MSAGRIGIEIVLHTASCVEFEKQTPAKTRANWTRTKPRKRQVHDENTRLRANSNNPKTGGQADVRLRVFVSDESCSDMIDARREY